MVKINYGFLTNNAIYGVVKKQSLFWLQHKTSILWQSISSLYLNNAINGIISENQSYFLSFLVLPYLISINIVIVSLSNYDNCIANDFIKLELFIINPLKKNKTFTFSENENTIRSSDFRATKIWRYFTLPRRFI